jgi:hypothetical protein
MAVRASVEIGRRILAEQAEVGDLPFLINTRCIGPEDSRIQDMALDDEPNGPLPPGEATFSRPFLGSANQQARTRRSGGRNFARLTTIRLLLPGNSVMARPNPAVLGTWTRPNVSVQGRTTTYDFERRASPVPRGDWINDQDAPSTGEPVKKGF